MALPGFRALLLFGVSVFANAELSEQSCTANVERLKKELAEAKAGAEPFSFVETATRAGNIGADVAGYVLNTGAGKRLVEFVGTHLNKTKVSAKKIAGKVTSSNYTEFLEGIKRSDTYLTHVAPHVEKATTAIKPHWEQYGNPALEKGSRAYETFQQRVLPSLQTVQKKALDIVMTLPPVMRNVLVHFDLAIGRMFDAIGRNVSAKLVASLPNNTIDRIIFLFLCAFFGFHFLGALWKLVLVAFFMMRICAKVAWVLFRFCVLLPLKVVRWVLGFVVCVGTGFYCCGLCRRKKSAQDLAAKADKQSNGKNGANGSKEKVSVATVAEVQRLLEVAKKEKKLEAAAKQMVSMAKNGKVMSAPKSMAGKTLTKDVVTKALANFKELDVKKLDL